MAVPRFLGRPGDPLTDSAAKAAAEELELHRGGNQGMAVNCAGSTGNGFGEPSRCSRLAEPLTVRLAIGKPQRILNGGRRVDGDRRTWVQQLSQPLERC